MMPKSRPGKPCPGQPSDRIIPERTERSKSWTDLRFIQETKVLTNVWKRVKLILILCFGSEALRPPCLLDLSDFPVKQFPELFDMELFGC